MSHHFTWAEYIHGFKFFIQSEKEEKKAQIHKQLVISIGECIRRLEEAGNPVYLMAVWGDLASTSY